MWPYIEKVCERFSEIQKTNNEWREIMFAINLAQEFAFHSAIDNGFDPEKALQNEIDRQQQELEAQQAEIEEQLIANAEAILYPLYQRLQEMRNADPNRAPREQLENLAQSVQDAAMQKQGTAQVLVAVNRHHADAIRQNEALTVQLLRLRDQKKRLNTTEDPLVGFIKEAGARYSASTSKK